MEAGDTRSRVILSKAKDLGVPSVRKHLVPRREGD